MKTTDQTLIEQLKITKQEIERRKEYLGFTEQDISILLSLRELISDNIDEIVEEFYRKILTFHEMDRVIGDAETLHRLKNYLRNYIVSLFDGHYDEDYVHSRLRVGVVHNRIGVDPKFYVSAVHNLSTIIRNAVSLYSTDDCHSCVASLTAIDKIIMFDLSLTFDTYINSLMEETRRSKEELEHYTESLEEVISERTKLLKRQAHYDGLTNLLNQRSFYTELRRELARGQRRNHSTVLIYFDLDGFKKLNDSQGHKRGDEILVAVAKSLKSTLRENEISARYGGDEFCIILPESTLEEAERLCQRLCEVIKRSTEDTGVSCSMGIAISSPENNYDANLLVRKADKAMYEAKKESGFSIKTEQEL
ncbi:MAG: GGDEF domain-containing protein [Proteobacteria bacterium]|nr:GGDEF domain-containing protein [Pseudomonadota bacterium]MBU1419616.1 GGDEF domain-containing protein [Pseudomonadota bacterium]MBU1453901.1 GGDEF domain-containing protein [Pseudomonadota bacterium]